MNKLAIIVLLALVGCGLARAHEAQVDSLLDNMEIVELGDEEASSAGNDGVDTPAGLSQEQAYFRDFCVKAQDEIKNYIREKLNGAASNIYTILLTSASDVGEEILKAQTKAVVEGTAVIKEATETTSKSDDVEENVEKAVDQIAERPNLINRLGNAVKMVIGAAIDAARSVVFRRVNELKEQLGKENLKLKIDEACNSVSSELQPRLERTLRDAKNSLKNELSGQEELLAQLSKLNTNRVGCAVTARVYKTDKFCQVLKLAGPAIYGLVGISD